ncbi:MAG: single-stranded DNA-binding protein [Gemmatimonas sp.]|nr:single-stranded DNA-binding protein [Gemmatimonas sp.]
MTRSINKIILVGNVGRDPDVQITSTGTKVAHLSLATSRRIPKERRRRATHRLAPADPLGPTRPVRGGQHPQGRPAPRRGAPGVWLIRAERRHHPHGRDRRTRGRARREFSA